MATATEAYTPNRAASHVMRATPNPRLEAVREAVKERGAAWFGAYLKAHMPKYKKLSKWTTVELAALEKAARG